MISRVPEKKRPHEIAPDYSSRAGYNFLWPAYDHYAVKDGVIQPDAGARLRFYDAWKHKTDFGRERVDKPLYVSLLNLKDHLTFQITPKAQFLPTETAIEHLLAWCNEHGLLGLVPAMYQELVFPEPQLPKQTRQIGQVHKGSHTRFVRWDGHWSQKHLPVNAPDHKRERPNGRRWKWEDHDWIDENLDHRFFRHFPSLDAKTEGGFPLPTPTCDAFWPLYGEPVEDFCRWVVRFSDAVQILSKAVFPKDGALEPVNRATALLTSYAGFVGRVVHGDVTRFRRIPDSPALLCTVAEMFLQDLEEGRFLKSCPVCSEYFVAREDSIAYCSGKCRNTAQRRRDRTSSEESE